MGTGSPVGVRDMESSGSVGKVLCLGVDILMLDLQRGDGVLGIGWGSLRSGYSAVW